MWSLNRCDYVITGEFMLGAMICAGDSIFFCFFLFFFFKQKTAYEIGTGDWSSDVCSSDLLLLDVIG